MDTTQKVTELLAALKRYAGVRAEGGALSWPAELSVEFLVALGDEPVAIGRVVEAEALGALVRLRTAKGEDFYVAAERVAGLKVLETKAEELAAGKAAGFRE